MNFPKTQRFALGNTCSDYLLTVLEYILSAAAEKNSDIKLRTLKTASTKLDTLKLLVRLCKDCHCISNEQYLNMQSCLQTIGKQIGGWINNPSGKG